MKQIEIFNSRQEQLIAYKQRLERETCPIMKDYYKSLIQSLKNN